MIQHIRAFPWAIGGIGQGASSELVRRAVSSVQQFSRVEESTANETLELIVPGIPGRRLVVHGFKMVLRAAAAANDFRFRFQEQNAQIKGIGELHLVTRWEDWIGTGSSPGTSSGFVNDYGFALPDGKSAIFTVGAAGVATITNCVVWGWYDEPRHYGT